MKHDLSINGVEVAALKKLLSLVLLVKLRFQLIKLSFHLNVDVTDPTWLRRTTSITSGSNKGAESYVAHRWRYSGGQFVGKSSILLQASLHQQQHASMKHLLVIPCVFPGRMGIFNQNKA